MTSLKLAPAVALAVGLAVGLCASCSSGPPSPNPNQTESYKAVFVNPYPAGTYEHFTADPSYPKTYKVFKNQEFGAALNVAAMRLDW